MKPRSEDDLRAAFQLAALDAPASEDLLAKVRSATAGDPFAPARVTRTRARQWLPIVGVAAVAIAIAVPVGFAISNRGAGTRSSASESFAAPDKAVAGAASLAASGELAPGAATGPINSGPINTAPVNPIAPGSSAPSAGALCQPSDVSLTLSWVASGSGLQGTLTARNISGVTCDLAVKPAIYPLDAGGQRLAVQNVATAEGYAGPSQLVPGATASSTITWNSWCGAKAVSGAQVEWGTGAATVTGTGPTNPSCVSGKSGSISSTWFGPLS